MLKIYVFLIYQACLQINPLTTFTNTRKGKIKNSHELMSVQKDYVLPDRNRTHDRLYAGGTL